MYAGIIAYKGGTKAAAAAATRAAAAAAKRPNDDIVIRNADADLPSQSSKSTLPVKKLNSDGSFGDPKPRFQSSGKVPQPWTCPRPDCGRNNFQWRKSCPHCGTKKPQESVSLSAPTAAVNLTEISSRNEEAKFEPPPAKKPCRTPAPPPEEVAKGNQANANLQGLGTRRGGFGGRGRGRGGASGESMAERLARMAGMAGGSQTNTTVTSGFGTKKQDTSEPSPELGGKQFDNMSSVKENEKKFNPKNEAKKFVEKLAEVKKLNEQKKFNQPNVNQKFIKPIEEKKFGQQNVCVKFNQQNEPNRFIQPNEPKKFNQLNQVQKFQQPNPSMHYNQSKSSQMFQQPKEMKKSNVPSLMDIEIPTPMNEVGEEMPSGSDDVSVPENNKGKPIEFHKIKDMFKEYEGGKEMEEEPDFFVPGSGRGRGFMPQRGQGGRGRGFGGFGNFRCVIDQPCYLFINYFSLLKKYE